MATRAIVLIAIVLAGCGRPGTHPESPPALASVIGSVRAAPGCPVERADSACPARPVPGADVVASVTGTVVARTRSAADGSFTLALVGGSYTLTATTHVGLRQSVSRSLLVPPHGVVRITLTLDSGIR